MIFKTRVAGVEMRADGSYWIETPPLQLTWRLEAVAENVGDRLDEATLRAQGFKGGRSLQHPMYSNEELLRYIESQFESQGGISLIGPSANTSVEETKRGCRTKNAGVIVAVNIY